MFLFVSRMGPRIRIGPLLLGERRTLFNLDHRCGATGMDNPVFRELVFPNFDIQNGSSKVTAPDNYGNALNYIVKIRKRKCCSPSNTFSLITAENE